MPSPTDIDIGAPDGLVPQESSDETNAKPGVSLAIEDVLRLTTVQNDEDSSERDLQNQIEHTAAAATTTHTKSGRKTKRTKSGGSTKLKRAVKNEKKSVDKVVQAVIQNYEESPSSLEKTRITPKRTKTGSSGDCEAQDESRTTVVIESVEKKQSKVTIDSAGAIAVFPSDSEHNTRRRSVTNHRRISDADTQDEEAQIQPTREDLDFTLEEVPEPPQSQVIHAVATYQQQNVVRSVTEGTTGSASRDTSRDTISALRDSEAGTVTATAVSSETYYEEIRQKVQQEAVAAVAVVSLNDDDPPKDTKDNSDRKAIQQYALFGCCLGILLIVVVIVVTTYQKKFKRIGQEEPETFEECGEDSRCYMQLLWTTDLGSYWRKRIARILPRTVLEALLTDTDYSSPRQQAFYYLVKNGNDLYGVDNMVDMGSEELDMNEKQRVLTIYALVTFYVALGGDDWLVNTDWLNPDVDVCSWYGVHCRSLSPVDEQPEAFPSDIAAPPPGDLDDDTKTEESSQLLGAKAPSQLFSLHSLILDGNNLLGKIPSEIMLLSNMNGMLQLSDNRIYDLIPPDIAKLSKLEGFDIHDNQFSSILPSGMSGMTNLRVFDISYNIRIQGSLISFDNWKKIEDLQIQSTKLEGEINPSFCDMIKSRESGDVPFQFKYSDDFVFRAQCKTNKGTTYLVDCPCCTECCEHDSVCTVNNV